MQPATMESPASNSGAFFNPADFYRCYAVLEKSVADCFELTMPELFIGLQEGDYSLYTLGDSAIITEIVELSAGTVLSCVVAGGTLEEINALRAQVEAAYTAQGIEKFMFIGRPGWEKALPDYQRRAVIFTKGF